MAVARYQILEIMEIILRFVNHAQLTTMLKLLKGTQAYEFNKSFRDTIDRLDQACFWDSNHQEKRP